MLSVSYMISNDDNNLHSASGPSEGAQGEPGTQSQEADWENITFLRLCLPRSTTLTLHHPHSLTPRTLIVEACVYDPILFL